MKKLLNILSDFHKLRKPKKSRFPILIKHLPKDIATALLLKYIQSESVLNAFLHEKPFRCWLETCIMNFMTFWTYRIFYRIA